MSAEAVIRSIAAREGWERYTVEEILWSSNEWVAKPKLNDIANSSIHLIRRFDSYQVTAAPTGTWTFRGLKGSVTYDRAHARVRTEGGNAFLESDLVVELGKDISVAQAAVGFNHYTSAIIIKLTKL